LISMAARFAPDFITKSISSTKLMGGIK